MLLSAYNQNMTKAAKEGGRVRSAWTAIGDIHSWRDCLCSCLPGIADEYLKFPEEFPCLALILVDGSATEPFTEHTATIDFVFMYVKDATRLLDIYSNGLPAKTMFGDEARKCLRAGNKIGAIRAMMGQHPGITLLEAKRLCDEWKNG